LRIAVIGPRGIPSSYSGVERIVEDLFAMIAAAGHHVTVYCRPEVLSSRTGLHKGVRLVRAPAPGGKNLETLSHSLASTVHAITKGDIHDGGKRFDVISYHTIAPGLFAPIARVAGIPVVNHVHGLDWQREKWRGLGSCVLKQCERIMVRHASHVVGVNPDIGHYYQEKFGLHVDLIPNGVHPVSDEFAPDGQTLERFGLTAGHYAVSVGRLVPEKRIHDTIAAFTKLPPDFKMVFVGEGKHSPEYVQQLHQLAASHRNIVFTGLQNGQALESLFRSARLYITSSELEGLPSSLLECMERRVPVIASDITPHRLLLGEYAEYDWLFPVGDTDALARRIQDAWTDPERARRVAERSREFVRENYSWPKLVAATIHRYQQVVAEAVEQSRKAGESVIAPATEPATLRVNG
jgi:glycosyltransferase involved in cell wall biosynthesis